MNRNASKGKLTVYKQGKHLYLRLPDMWKRTGLKDGDQLPAKSQDNRVTIDFRKIIGRKINNSFKDVNNAYTESDMKKAFGKQGWTD